VHLFEMLMPLQDAPCSSSQAKPRTADPALCRCRTHRTAAVRQSVVQQILPYRTQLLLLRQLSQLNSRVIERRQVTPFDYPVLVSVLSNVPDISHISRHFCLLPAELSDKIKHKRKATFNSPFSARLRTFPAVANSCLQSL
jgi:hypothetical protein